MAALLKKRALAEYSQVIQEENVPEPRKKLRLVYKSKSSEPPLSFQGLTTNEEIFNCILKFERTLPIETEHLDHCMRLLLDQYHTCRNSTVQAKIASLLGQLSRTPNVDINRIVNDILNLLKFEGSNKVISQLLEALLTCGQIVPYNKKLHLQLIKIALEHLNNSSHLVKAKCLNMIGSLGSPDLSLNMTEHDADGPSTSSNKSHHTEKKASLQQTLGKFTHDADSRVRMTAFEAMLSWHKRGLKLEHAIYGKACQALSDDFEGVRSVAIKLIWVLSQLYPERKIKVEGTDEEIRLIDDGFAKICDMVNDGSINVRTEAASLLGSLHGVSPKFLDQTLEKMLMKDMQRRVSTTDRLRQTFSGSGGGFSSGKMWASDAPPKDGSNDESVTLMAMGACGAFVHGLEDEFMEVRMASIDSVCELATRSQKFAMQCLDVLVDMFNDEIEMVQLNAINSLRKISQVIVLREDQLEIIMGCMKAQSYEVREAFRNLLGCVKFATKNCLNTCILGNLELLKKYPQDKLDLWKCMKNTANKHPSFVLNLTPDLLSCHPYFEAIEPDVEDPAYIAVLLLVFNAAVHCPSIVSLFPDHTVRHYTYLRDTLPELVPHLNLQKAPIPERMHTPPRCTSPNSFLHQTLDRLQSIDKLDSNGATQLMQMGIRDLERVSELEASLAPNAILMSMYLDCHLCLCKVLNKSNEQISFLTQSQVNAGPLLDKVVTLTHRMEHEFLGLAIGDCSQMIQLRILAQSAQLLHLLQNNLTGMKQSCVQYLQILNNFERFLVSNNLTANEITQCLLSNMNKLETCDPAVYHTVLAEAVCKYKPQLLRLNNNVKKASACIIEPSGSLLEKTVTFITGLSASVDLIITLENLEETGLVRIQVKYPDQQVHTFIPKISDFRQLSPCRHRLITKVLLSHQQWSEACQVELSVVLNYTKDKKFSEDRTGDKYKKTEDYIQLCKPIKLSVSPKALKK